MRTCVVCRKRKEKHSLIRFVLRNCKDKGLEKIRDSAEVYELALDTLMRLQARGAYCHISSSCLKSKSLEIVLSSLLKGSRKERKRYYKNIERQTEGMQTAFDELIQAARNDLKVLYDAKSISNKSLDLALTKLQQMEEQLCQR